MKTIDEAIALADREIDAALASADHDSLLRAIPRDLLREAFLLEFARACNDIASAMREKPEQLNG